MASKSTDKTGLNNRQYLFCEYYLQSGVAAKAYVQAGYSQNNKYSGSSELLANPKIKAYLARARKSRHSNFLLGYQEALKQLTKLAKGLQREDVVVMEQDIMIDDDGNRHYKTEPKIVKKRVDGKVQFAAIKEVLNLHEKTDQTVEMEQTTDDRLYKAMKNRVADSSQISVPKETTFEEDTVDDVINSSTPEEEVVEHVS